jgi:hypothetical protein
LAPKKGCANLEEDSGKKINEESETVVMKQYKGEQEKQWLDFGEMGGKQSNGERGPWQLS